MELIIILFLALCVVVLINKLNKARFLCDRAVAQTAMVIDDYNFVVDNRIFAIVKNDAGEIYFFCFVPKTYIGFEFQLCKLENDEIVVVEKSDYFSDKLYSAWLATFDKDHAVKFYTRMQTASAVKALKDKRAESMKKARNMFGVQS